LRTFNEDTPLSDCSDCVRFRVTESDAPPTVTSPTLNTTNTMPAIRKTAVADAAGDDIQINDQTAFVTTHGLTTTVFQPQTPLPSGTYRARVRHVDAGGTYSVWWAPDLQLHIDTGAIEQITCPLAEALIASENLVPGWTSAATAMIYELWVSDLTTGAGRIIRETSLAEMAFTTVMQLAAGQYLAWFRAIGFVQLGPAT